MINLDFNVYYRFYLDINMHNYKNVNVDKIANIYFEGNVISRNIFLKDGSRKTQRVMLLVIMNLTQKKESLWKLFLEN